MSLCVYALIPPSERRSVASARPALRGVAGERLHPLRIGTLDAIVGEVTRAPGATTDNLRRYNRVLTSLWARTSALLPVRFATVVGDAAELDLLVGRGRQQMLRRQLAAVRGRAQMTVRILGGLGAGDRGLVQPDPRSPALDPQSRGRAYLQARVDRAQRARELPEFAPLWGAVRRWVRAERVEKKGGVATMYHLVPRGASGRYRRALEHAAAAADVRLIVTGPWPPYAFADGPET